HAGSGAPPQRARRFGADLSGRRALGHGVARLQGGPGVHRHQSRSAGGAGGHRGHAGTAADWLGPSAQRQCGAARGRPDLYHWAGCLRPDGVDRAALSRGVAIARSDRSRPRGHPVAALIGTAANPIRAAPGSKRVSAALCFLAASPAADFTTYIGDANDYRVARVLADASGNTYVAGSRGGGMFVMKLDAAGKIALFATLSGKEIGRASCRERV